MKAVPLESQSSFSQVHTIITDMSALKVQLWAYKVIGHL